MPNTPVIEFLDNRVFDEIAVGKSASLTLCIIQCDTALFAIASEAVNPARLTRRAPADKHGRQRHRGQGYPDCRRGEDRPSHRSGPPQERNLNV